MKLANAQTKPQPTANTTTTQQPTANAQANAQTGSQGVQTGSAIKATAPGGQTS